MKRPLCPICGKELSYNVVVRACKTYKINKNGMISKHSKVLINGEDSDIIYLRCEDYKCNFYYNLTYKDKCDKIYKDLDDWFEKQF